MVWWGLSLPPSSPAPPLLGYIWERIGSRRCQHLLGQLMRGCSAKSREKWPVAMSVGCRRARVTVHLDQPQCSGSSDPMILLGSASSATSDQGANQTSTGANIENNVSDVRRRAISNTGAAETWSRDMERVTGGDGGSAREPGSNRSEIRGPNGREPARLAERWRASRDWSGEPGAPWVATFCGQVRGPDAAWRDSVGRYLAMLFARVLFPLKPAGFLPIQRLSHPVSSRGAPS